MSKNKVGKALVILEGLVEQLHYAYGGNHDAFKKHVLKDVSELEGIIRNLGEGKTNAFKRIAKKYENYRKTTKILDSIDNTKLTDSVRDRYRQHLGVDSE